MKKFFFAIIMISSFSGIAQKYMTKTAAVDFISKAPLETITALNKSAVCLLDIQTGALDVVVQTKSFVFEKQLMQEHFNENYMESDKYPKASFKGKVANISAVQWTKEGTYAIEVEGKMNLHGATKDIKEKGKIVVTKSGVTLSGSFVLLLANYNIAVPGAVKDKVAKDVTINLKANLEPYNK